MFGASVEVFDEIFFTCDDDRMNGNCWCRPMVLEDITTTVGGAAKLAPGAYISAQVTNSVPVWKLKIRRVADRIPLLGNQLRDDI